MTLEWCSSPAARSGHSWVEPVHDEGGGLHHGAGDPGQHTDRQEVFSGGWLVNHQLLCQGGLGCELSDW